MIQANYNNNVKPKSEFDFVNYVLHELSYIDRLNDTVSFMVDRDPYGTEGTFNAISDLCDLTERTINNLWSTTVNYMQNKKEKPQ